jgi:hypothetical protein
MAQSFNICHIAPRNYPHSHAFDEVVEGLVGSLRMLGEDVHVRHNEIVRGQANILIGANLLTAEQCNEIQNDVIVYNLEQVDGASPWLTPHYRRLLSRVRVLDYTDRNADRLRGLTGNGRIRVLPVGFWSGWSRIPRASVEDIDALFYGALNERRQRIISALRDKGVVVATAFGVYGAKRDALISRAKIVLNVHYYETSVFEVVRATYLLANRKVVAAECGLNTEIYPWLKDSCASTTYENLPGLVESILADGSMRNGLAAQGYGCVSAYPMTTFLKPLLEYLNDSCDDAISVDGGESRMDVNRTDISQLLG